jgi:hypothetical protein
MEIKQFLMTAACVALLFSCKKEDTTFDKAKVQGEWKIVDRAVSFKWINVYTNAIEIITSSYVLPGRSGSISFDADSIRGITGGGDMKVIEKAELYKGTELLRTSITPKTYAVEILYSIDNYKWVGNDSIFADSGRGLGVNAAAVTPPYGGRFRWSKDTLVYTTTSTSPDTSYYSATKTTNTRYKLLRQ